MCVGTSNLLGAALSSKENVRTSPSCILGDLHFVVSQSYKVLTYVVPNEYQKAPLIQNIPDILSYTTLGILNIRWVGGSNLSYSLNS